MNGDHVDRIIEQWNEQRPDVDVEGMAVIGRISRLGRAISPLLAQVFAEHDLEPWEFDVLATLRRSGPPFQLTAGELMSSMMVTSGAVTNRIDRLEQRGLIRRDKDSEDGRIVRVGLTTEGLRKIDSALPDHAANELRLVTALTPEERETLVVLLRKLHTDLSHHKAQ